jgi:hypothetical protein
MSNLVLKEGRVEIAKQLNNHCTSYDLDFPRWGNMADTEFQALRRSPWIAGEFVWTGFDYIGEPTPFAWPNRSSSFGIVDLCGFKKDRYYLYQSQWRPEPMVHLLPHWNWSEEFRGKEIPVWCYTNAESVELSLNGRSIGVRDWTGVTELHLSWQVPYEPGTLRAIARRGGKIVATDEVQTTGAPARIELAVDRASCFGRTGPGVHRRASWTRTAVQERWRPPASFPVGRSRDDRRGGQRRPDEPRAVQGSDTTSRLPQGVQRLVPGRGQGRTDGRGDHGGGAGGRPRARADDDTVR